MAHVWPINEAEERFGRDKAASVLGEALQQMESVYDGETMDNAAVDRQKALVARNLPEVELGLFRAAGLAEPADLKSAPFIDDDRIGQIAAGRKGPRRWR